MIHCQFYYKNTLVDIISVDLPFNDKNCDLVRERLSERVIKPPENWDRYRLLNEIDLAIYKPL